MNKLVILTLISMLSLSCSVSTPDNSSSSPFTLHSSLDFSDLEKEYKSFSTKTLSDAYVSRMFNKFLTTSQNPAQVIRQLEFARYLKDVKSDSNYVNSIKTFIGGDSNKFNLINNTSGVTQKKTTEPTTFGVFVDSLNPNPSSPIVTSGLVLNLDAGNISSYSGSGTTWNDLSGNGYNGTLINGVGYNSDNSGSLLFDGADDYVTGFSNISVNTGSPFTIEAWVNLSSFSCFYPTIIQLKTNSTSPFIIFLSQSGGYAGINFGSYNTWTRIKTNNIPTTGNWHHIVITYNGLNSDTMTNFNTYLDNTSQALIGSGSFAQFDQVNYIGTLSAASRGLDNWNGKISAIKIYSRVLSSPEVQQNYDALKGRYGL